jgi:DNA-binding XRE family transcriptional regulator
MGLTFVPKKPRPSPPGLEILQAGTGEFVLLINGRHVQGNQTMLALLARLFDNLGTVIPYEQLCLSIGHKSANSAATHVLRQYIGWLRGVLIANKAPYVITVAREVGYGLCRMGGEPRGISTSRSALPELGRNLRRVRTAAGLTQTALAKRSGMDRSYVSGLEAGQRNPTALTLKRLAKILGVTPIAFFL